MAYSFDQIFAADPSNPSNVAQNASVTIFAPGDGTMTPLTITDPDGQPLANPITTNANGFGSAFAHATLDRVAWAGGDFTGFFTSYEGMKAEAVAARTAADTAAADASNSATAAATSASLVGAPADTAVQTLINNTGSATREALNATYLKLGHTDYATATAPMVELATTAGSGRIFHLLSGSGSTSEIMGIGVDNPDSAGVTISCKSSGNIGLGVNLETTSTSTSTGYLGAVLGPGTGMELRKGSQDGGTLLNLRADYGGTGTLLTWGQGTGDVKGQIKEDGALWVQSAATDQNAIRVGKQDSNIGLKFYHWSGTPSLWFASQVTTQGQSLLFQSSAGASAIGGETLNTLIEIRNGNTLAFFGGAGSTKPTGVAVTAAGIHAALVSLGLIGA